jgi:hypothetical protein
MRVCQFRHFGFDCPFGSLVRSSSADTAVTKFKCVKPCVACQFNAPSASCSATYGARRSKMRLEMINDSKNPETAREEIPEELALEIRRLAHDLSNALEIIVQTSYLLSTVELKEPASDWLRLLDSGVQKALEINLSLRTYIKSHTAS